MSNRFEDADLIWNGGASNPRAVARALVRAIDEASSEAVPNGDAAVVMILDHLCFLCGLPQPSSQTSIEYWTEVERVVQEGVDNAKS